MVNVFHLKSIQKHVDWVGTDSWAIEGLGTLESFWLRIDAADTLI